MELNALLEKILFSLNDKDNCKQHYNIILNRYKRHKRKTKRCIERQFEAVKTIKDAYMQNKGMEDCVLCNSMQHTFVGETCEYCIWNITRSDYVRTFCKCISLTRGMLSQSISLLRHSAAVRLQEDKDFRIKVADAQIEALEYMLTL